jgi:hypothetical protein
MGLYERIVLYKNYQRQGLLKKIKISLRRLLQKTTEHQTFQNLLSPWKE